jgi:predicted transcriptional regulator YheO
MLLVSDLKTNVTRDESILEVKLSSLQNTIILYIASNGYSSRNVQSSENEMALKIYYQDPFASKYTLNSFHNNDTL